jgi:hypothetical protein
MKYSADPISPVADEEKSADCILEPGLQQIMDPTENEITHLAESTVESIVKALPKVSILEERTPDTPKLSQPLTRIVDAVRVG